MTVLSKHLYGEDHSLIGKFVILESGEPALVYGSYTISEAGYSDCKMLAVLTAWSKQISGMVGIRENSVLPISDGPQLRGLAHRFLARIADEVRPKV